MAQDAITAV
nr:RecName: Full=Allophycocyanin beta chain [Anabaena sp. L-31]